MPTVPTWNREQLRDDWQKWMEEAAATDELITRDELTQRLSAEGIEVAPNDLRYWQTEGVLPHPVRRWHDGATRGLYPAQLVDVVRHLRRLQAEGYTVRYLGPQLLNYARIRSSLERVTPEEIERNRERNRDHPWDMEEQLLAVAAAHERRTGTKITRVELRLFDEQGHPLTYTFPHN